MEFISKANHLDDRHGCDSSCVSARKAFGFVLRTLFNKQVLYLAFWLLKANYSLLDMQLMVMQPPGLAFSSSLSLAVRVFAACAARPGSGTAQLKEML